MQNHETMDYDDIIDLPHHISKVHPQMSLEKRAAQFAPFSALTGYGDAVTESARLTDCRLELDEDAKGQINAKLQVIMLPQNSEKTVCITHFVPDEKKNGGAYVNTKGYIKKYDAVRKLIILCDGREIAIDDVIWIE